MDYKAVVSHSEGDRLMTIRCADCNGHIVVLHWRPGCAMELREHEIARVLMGHPANCVALWGSKP